MSLQKASLTACIISVLSLHQRHPHPSILTSLQTQQKLLKQTHSFICLLKPKAILDGKKCFILKSLVHLYGTLIHNMRSKLNDGWSNINEDALRNFHSTKKVIKDFRAGTFSELFTRTKSLVSTERSGPVL